MHDRHGSFYPSGRRHKLLIVDDEPINRAILSQNLKEDYEILTASNGQEALKFIEAEPDALSLILLDLQMPGIHGLDLIRILKDNPVTRNIPVIVLSVDQDAEVACLGVGAIDFISKPYPDRSIILARVNRIIELQEDRNLILHTERDSLTQLFNREYFYRYAHQMDELHPDMPMDAIVLDIQHFHVLNERYGKAYGDTVLCTIAHNLREHVADANSILCRMESDTFLIYRPHRDDYREMIDHALHGLPAEAENRVRLRMGVYAHPDKTLEVETRFARAKVAASSVRNNYLNNIALYDTRLHETEIYHEQLLEDFQHALECKEFQVYYQPKFSIQEEVPLLCGAEALVRWVHPRLGMVSPGDFIPLFEENGLIFKLDAYVWRETARQIREWQDTLGFSVPVSVNVSRVDMYDPGLPDLFQSLLKEFRLSPDALHLEITESAYTQNSSQIIETVSRLREIGFAIEMDDFGTGYSSLNMISTLPLDILKLDMMFIRDAFRNGKDTRLIEIIIDIANYLQVPVVAEGVETLEQMNTLRTLGCSTVQGYYFSKPLPAQQFTLYLEDHREKVTACAAEGYILPLPESPALLSRITGTFARCFKTIYHVDPESGAFARYSTAGGGNFLHLEQRGDNFFADPLRDMDSAIFPEDRERLSLLLQKETLLSKLSGCRHFFISFRQKDNDGIRIGSLQAALIPGDRMCLVMGIRYPGDLALPADELCEISLCSVSIPVPLS